MTQDKIERNTIQTKRIKRGTRRVFKEVYFGVGYTSKQRLGHLRGNFPELRNANIDKSGRDMGTRASMFRRQAINKGILMAQRICLKCQKSIQYCRCYWS